MMRHVVLEAPSGFHRSDVLLQDSVTIWKRNKLKCGMLRLYVVC